jgi:hypothetical protein
LNGNDARRALLEGLWDYAGVFPPAELSLEDALDEWRRIRASDDAWLVNRLVVRPEHVRLCGAEPLAIVEGAEERQGDQVFREGETKLRCGGARVPAAEDFLNLLAAAVFGDEEEMLATREIALDAASFRADGRSADAARCRDVRRGLFRSIGSCSFAEPVGELRALGIL